MMKSPHPYERFQASDLSLTDLLAIDRTTLANERTVLAYARTCIALLVMGGSAVKFFVEPSVRVFGVGLIALALALALLGMHRFGSMRKRLKFAVAAGKGGASHTASSQETPQK